VETEVISSKRLPSFANVGIAHAVRHDNWIFISGQIAIDAEGKIVGKGDVAGQTRCIYEIISGMLGDLGGSLRNVVKLLTFYVNPDDFGAMAAVRKSYFASGHLAASSAVCVRALAHPDALVEVQAIAILDERAKQGG
jgi:enamine deaminase RidA (YjgF/YER057c/UK114 family)